MEPVTAVTSALTLVKSAADLSEKLEKLWKTADRETKQQVEAILDKLHELKRSAAALEDENRNLREKLRFKSDDYEFHNPFWFEKNNARQALCAKCFAQQIPAPMGEPGQGCNDTYRRCLVCNNTVQVAEHRYVPSPAGSNVSPWG
jgi:hypothetical protein